MQYKTTGVYTGFEGCQRAVYTIKFNTNAAVNQGELL